MKALEEAIDTARRAVQSTPADHPNLPIYLNSLGTWLRTRFEWSGEMKDLEEAIDSARRAVQLTPMDHPNQAAYLQMLSKVLSKQHERTRAMKDLNASEGRKALQEAAPRGHIDTVKMLLENSAKVNAPSAYRWGRIALQAAEEGGHVDIVKMLLEKTGI